jgi:signal transduction histidine kinase
MFVSKCDVGGMEDTLSLLIVDDDQVDRMTVRRALKSAGVKAEYTEAEDYMGAIATLKAAEFDCIFIDYRLPDQDGLTLIQKVRAAKIYTPIVVLTGQGDEQIAVELMKAGASDYLAKHRISPDVLERLLRNAIRIYRAEQEVAIANQRLQESNRQLTQKNRELEEQRQQIQHQNLQLIKAGNLKSQFLATMSHELRTPLNAIIGFSQLLLRPSKGELTTKQSRMLQHIFRNGKHLLEMLDEILDFSKIEAGRLELKSEIVDLSHLIYTTIEELRSLAEGKQLELSADIQLTDTKVLNDSMNLRRILTNLLSNAIKFTETGKVWLEVTELDSNRIAIAVCDTGIGIAPTELKHVFEAFRQIDQSNTRRYGGTGLGLAIVDSLVQMMGGTICVDSAPGKGSVFRVELPRQIHSTQTQGLADLPLISANVVQSPVIPDC